MEAKASFVLNFAFNGGVRRSFVSIPTSPKNACRFTVKAAVREINSSNELDMALLDAGDRLAVLQFSAGWCGPCRVIAPIFESFSEKYKDVVFLYMQTDKNDDLKKLTQTLAIRMLPTFRFYHNGKRVDHLSSAKAALLEQAIIDNSPKKD
mmetsp:Transcript_18355/g.30170  ORF Transcript_18355/g.30170 Transcript_18355/m.30170 type:complete len:151 (+) Transcript_18355:31-483(+)